MTSSIQYPSDSGALQLPGDNRLNKNIDSAEINSAANVVHTLNRALKTLCLYPPDNPVCAEAHKNFFETISKHLESYQILTLGIRDSQFTFHGDILSRQSTEESRLANMCFESGVFELRFSEEFTAESAYELVALFRALASKERVDADLAEALWGEVYPGFAYDVIEDIPIVEYDDELRIQYFSERKDNEDNSHLSETDRFKQIFIGGEQSDDPRLEADSSERFESTLKELAGDDTESGADDSSDTRGAQMPSAREMMANVYILTSDEAHQVAAALADDALFVEDDELVALCIDLLAENEALPDFTDALKVCLRAHGKLIETASLAPATKLIVHLRNAEQSFTRTKPIWATKVNEALSTIGSRERLARLATALNDHQNIEVKELANYLNTLDWTSYAALIETLGSLESKIHRLTICEYLGNVDDEHLDLIASGMYDKRWYVVRNSVVILSQYDHDRAHKHLLKAFIHPDERVRKEAMLGCKNHDNEFFCQVLQICIDDPDQDICDEALKLTCEQDGEHAFELLCVVANRKIFAVMSYEFRTKILDCYSKAGGDRAVSGLVYWIKRASFFPSQEKKELQAIALGALTRNSSPDATKALKKLSASWIPEIRRNAKLAMKQRSQANEPRKH